MIELAQLFQDMEAAVVEQEPAVQKIDERGEETVTHIGDGNKQLDQAVDKARAARKKKWICLGIFSMLSLESCIAPPLTHNQSSSSSSLPLSSPSPSSLPTTRKSPSSVFPPLQPLYQNEYKILRISLPSKYYSMGMDPGLRFAPKGRHSGDRWRLTAGRQAWQMDSSSIFFGLSVCSF